MEFRDTLSRANSLVEQVTGKLASIAPLATRIVIGLAFFQAGTGKFRYFENVVGFFHAPNPALGTDAHRLSQPRIPLSFRSVCNLL